MGIGLDAKAFTGVAGTPAATELKIVREVTMDLSNDDIVSAYRDSVLKSHEAGQGDLTLSLTVKYKPDDPGFIALVDAAVNRTTIAMQILHKTGGKGWDADWAVLTMSEPQPIDGVLEVTFGLAVNTDLRAATRI